VNVMFVWVDAGVLAPFEVALVTGYFAIEDYVSQSFIRSGK